MTEIWFRNPRNYAIELAEVGNGLIAWDRGMLHKLNIDPMAHGNLFFGERWRALMIGAQGTMEIGPQNSPLNPVAVYPTWCYGDPTALLEEMIQYPAGQDEASCFDLHVQVDERPVWGQEHRVVIAEGPPGGASTALGRKFYRYVSELQQDHPEVRIHLHNSYSFRIMFGLEFGSADFDPRLFAQKGNVVLSSGSSVAFEVAQKNPKWLSVVGMMPEDLADPKKRCMFNIKSAIWAAENYAKSIPFKISRTGSAVTDVVTPTADYKPTRTVRFTTTNGTAKKVGDYIACDTCSIASNCKYEREGAVCSVPNSEGSDLAKYFKTRDSAMIIDGLAEVMALGTQRLRDGMDEESMSGINPEVTKMLKTIFDQGVTLAKLVDPALRSPKVAVNVQTGGGNAEVTMGSPKVLVSQVIRTLEQQGYRREDITPTMVEGVLAGMINPDSMHRAIEGTVISDGL